MKTKLASGLILSLLMLANASGAAHTSPLTPNNERVAITIGVYNYAHAKSDLLFEAQQTAAAILLKAGVGASWLSCPTDHASTRIPACAATADPTHLTLRILPDSMSSRLRLVSKDMIGFAAIGEGLSCNAWILYDRARDFAARRQLTLASLLGSAIAHELGHLLLGDSFHSKAGLMRARWSGKDFLAMERDELVFSVAETERIQRAVIARRQASSAINAEVLSSDSRTPRN
jgi:hypothetical protein